MYITGKSKTISPSHSTHGSNFRLKTSRPSDKTLKYYKTPQGKDKKGDFIDELFQIQPKTLKPFRHKSNFQSFLLTKEIFSKSVASEEQLPPSAKQDSIQSTRTTNSLQSNDHNNKSENKSCIINASRFPVKHKEKVGFPRHFESSMNEFDLFVPKQEQSKNKTSRQLFKVKGCEKQKKIANDREINAKIDSLVRKLNTLSYEETDFI